MSFLRHHEIYRSDVVGALRRGSASASLCWGQCIAVVMMPGADREKANGERNRSHVPRSSSAMSLGSAIPWRVALQQSPPPLYRPESMLHPPAETVNHHLPGAGEFSTGEMGKFQPALTLAPNHRLRAPSDHPSPADNGVFAGCLTVSSSLWYATRRFRDPVLRGTACDTTTSSAELGSPALRALIREAGLTVEEFARLLSYRPPAPMRQDQPC